MHKLKELKVWYKAISLSTDIYEVTTSFPQDEKYGLSSQIKRSVISIPSNIAEGAGRNSDKEFIQFLGIANGSSYELITQLTIAMKLGLLDKTVTKELCTKVSEIQKMIYGLQKKLKKG